VGVFESAEEQQQSRYREAIREYENRVAEYERSTKAWSERRAADENHWTSEEKLRLERLAELEQQHHSRQKEKLAREARERDNKVESLRMAWKTLRSSYHESPCDAAVYFELACSLSPLPPAVSHQVQFAYLPESRQLAIERELPLSNVIPGVAEYSFVKRAGELRSKPRHAKDVKRLYSRLIAALTLRTIHEAFLADVKGQIDVVAFNGFVDTRDHATGKRIKPCLVSVRVSREESLALDLDNIEEIACLRRLPIGLVPNFETRV
jgi:restriction system protein